MENKEVSCKKYFDIDIEPCFQKLKPTLICCGIPEDWAVQAISLIDVAISVIWIIYLIYANSSPGHGSPIPGLKVCWSLYFVISSVRICMSFILFNSAITQHRKKCRIWLLVTITILLTEIVVVCFHITFFHDHKERRYSVPVALTFLVYRLFAIFVVFKFMRSVAASKDNSLHGLTPEEIISFFNGQSRKATSAGGVETEPYDKTYEVNRDCLVVEEEHLLEKTDQDCILKGAVYYPSGAFSPVTVKNVAKRASNGYFKAVLSELKIMTVVATMGRHENILNLLGAVTSSISIDREVFILLEFIPFGNLLQYLKTNKRHFLNFVEEGVVCHRHDKEYCNIHPSTEKEFVTTYDLLHWCAQISKGLNFLSSIGIVHGDVRARNVYLSEGKVAKLSCPALPRQLYFYSIYESKSEEIPLPWRHMAIESLRDMNFTTESDVWNLGTTYWEVFSLGSVPFPGISWSTEFVNYLSRGLRMKKPAFAPDFVYRLMVQCWDITSSRRPTPQQLCSAFEDVLQDLTSRRPSRAGLLFSKCKSADYENA